MALYSNDTICVVSYGCVLPKAHNPQEFWQRISEGLPLVEEIETCRWNKTIADPLADPEEEISRSSNAVQIAESFYLELQKKFKLTGHSNRLTAYLFETLEQIFNGLKVSSRPERTAILLGLMNPDKSTYAQIVHKEKRFLDEYIDRQYPHMSDETRSLFAECTRINLENTSYLNHKDDYFENVLLSSLMKDVSHSFPIKGPTFYTDAACASSLVAIDLATSLLKNRTVDLVIAGGLESNLDYGTFVLFSRINALAEDMCLPFDRRSKGITHAEGSVAFALKRLEDAVRDGDKIHAVIKNVDGSSDGKSASLFQPTKAGQLYAYEKVHSSHGSTDLDYIEAHATGTAVGDQVEASSIAEFFQHQKCFIGSAKSVFGHTKGAAGATSLLKAIMMMEKGVIPPNPYIKESFFSEIKTKLVVNTHSANWPHNQEVRRVAVSSFGFGGSNFHMLVERPMGSIKLENNLDALKPVVVELGSIYVDKDASFKSEDYRVPPMSLPQIDHMQMLAVYGVDQLISQIKHRLLGIPKEKVGVISAGANGLQQLELLVKRIFYNNLIQSGLDQKNSLEFQTLIQGIRTHISDKIPKITEDSAPGILNNVIAGRVCNTFDFRNKNFSIDCDIASFDAACFAAYHEILIRPDQLFFVCGLDEEIDIEKMKIHRKGMRIIALTSEMFAHKHGLSVKNEIVGSRFIRESSV